MPPTTEFRAAGLSQNSFVSLGLVGTLVVGAMLFGRQLQRLDSIENELRELRTEVKEIRSSLRSQALGR
jgi:hypothetical protein